MKKRIIISIIGVTIIIGLSSSAIYLYQNNAILAQQNEKQIQQQPPTETKKENEITFPGKAGKTAFVLLQQNATIEYTGANGMEIVTSINGIKPDKLKNEYWSLIINDEPAIVGIGMYMTKDTDIITLKIDSLSFQTAKNQ